MSINYSTNNKSRGGSRAAATSKMERFVIIVNSFQPLTIITKRSILDAAAALDPPLESPYLLLPINFTVNISSFIQYNTQNTYKRFTFYTLKRQIK